MIGYLAWMALNRNSKKLDSHIFFIIKRFFEDGMMNISGKSAKFLERVFVNPSLYYGKVKSCDGNISRYIPSKPLTFQPAFWNQYAVCENTNCYSYALNIPFVGWGRPSLLRSKNGLDRSKCDVPYKKFIYAESLTEFLLQDGLVTVPQGEESLAKVFKQHLLVAFTSPSRAYHFYRRDCDGTWSHKPSERSIEKVGDLKSVYVSALGRGYSKEDFVGYFAIPEKGILFSRNFDL